MSIIGKWRPVDAPTSIPEAERHWHSFEYTSSDEYIQWYRPGRGGDPIKITTKCAYYPGKVRHLMEDGTMIDFTYEIDSDHILTIVDKRGRVWKAQKPEIV